MSEPERMKFSDLFGYVLVGPDGKEIERSNPPPSKWPEHIKAMFKRDGDK